MAWNYHNLTRRVRYYLLREKRKKSFTGKFLPRRIFDRQLWAWDERGIAVGAGWGAAWAIAPVPLQTLFAIASCVWRKGNIPVGVLMCWLSFPGYQVFVWPVQWKLGSLLLSWCGDSGASLQIVAQCAESISIACEAGGWEAVCEPMLHVRLGWLAAELLLGMLASCAASGLLCYAIVRLGWRIAKIAKRTPR